MRLFLATLALASVSISTAPAAAQTVGMQVVDETGAPVGTIIGVGPDVVTLKTNLHEVALPKSSFTPDRGKLLFGMTQAELNAETERAIAAAAASLQPGSPVKGKGGTVVGTIEKIDDESVTLKLEGGETVRIARSGIAPSADGAVIGLTAAELKALVVPAADQAS